MPAIRSCTVLIGKGKINPPNEYLDAVNITDQQNARRREFRLCSLTHLHTTILCYTRWEDTESGVRSQVEATIHIYIRVYASRATQREREAGQAVSRRERRPIRESINTAAKPPDGSEI